MAAPDMDVIKEIPGYKVILKAILKSQIQQLVEQLASHTDEESVILTASVSDGTLSHLGSDSGKTFLEDHEDIKSQFLGFCLRKHHRKEQQAKEQEMLQKAAATQSAGFQRSPRYPPTNQQGIHPVALTRASPRGVSTRHEPYSARPRRPTFEMQQSRAPSVRLPVTNQVIKIEHEDAHDSSEQTLADKSVHSSPASSPAVAQTDLASMGNSKSDSPFTVAKDTPDLKQDSNASDLSDSDVTSILPQTDSGSQQEHLSAPQTPGEAQTPGSSGGPNANTSIKLEAVTDAEMELEITGVELGPSQGSADPDDSWSAEMAAAGYGSSGAMGSQDDIKSSQPGYKDGSSKVRRTKRRANPKREQCELCQKEFHNNSNLRRHMRIHQGIYPFECSICFKRFSDNSNYKKHFAVHFIDTSGRFINPENIPRKDKGGPDEDQSEQEIITKVTMDQFISKDCDESVENSDFNVKQVQVEES